MSIAKDFHHEWEIDGTKMNAKIAPCTWMYPGHGFQLWVAMEGGGDVQVHNKQLTFTEATIEHALGMCAGIKLKPCNKCQKPAFDPEVHDTNRNGECESCFMTALNAEFDAIAKNEAKKLARRDATRLKQGYTHRISAWIHPDRGDDYQVDFYTKGEMSKAEIVKLLKKEGSRVLDDYQIIDLAVETKK